MTLAAALTQTIDARRYSEIIMTRATVSLGEDIGFLPGTEEEKMAPWMGALEDNLEVLHKSDAGGEWGRQASMDIIRNRVRVKSMSFMRGRTFLQKFVIIDEAQNLSPKQMKTLITRAGPGTKIVCLGNITHKRVQTQKTKNRATSRRSTRRTSPKGARVSPTWWNASRGGNTRRRSRSHAANARASRNLRPKRSDARLTTQKLAPSIRPPERALPSGGFSLRGFDCALAPDMKNPSDGRDPTEGFVCFCFASYAERMSCNPCAPASSKLASFNPKANDSSSRIRTCGRGRP